MRLFGLIRQAMRGARMVVSDPATAREVIAPRKSPIALSNEFYLTVLATTARLPKLSELANPDGSGGAVEGLPVPLKQGATKEDLNEPLSHGPYAIASKNRKTLLSMIVMHPDEAGYDPGPVVNSPLAKHLQPEAVLRLKSTWHLAQLSFKTYDPAVYPALDFLQDIAMRLGNLTDAVVADPHAHRYLLPNELRLPQRADAHADAREHVSVQRLRGASGWRVFTRGMVKFVHPEVELQDVEEDLVPIAEAVCMSVAQQAVMGGPLGETDLVELPGGRRLVAFPGGQDRALWEGIPVLELLAVERGSVNDVLRGTL